MKLFPHLKMFAAAVALLFATASVVHADHHMSGKKPYGAKDNIVQTAAGAGSFNTLLAAAKAAGLADTLATGGPFTVFAPTDEAFGKLPEGTVENLLKPENHEKLKSILLYHVVEGKVLSNQVKTGDVSTLAGESIRVSVEGGSVMVNDASVVKADVKASNGVIHVIDTVLLP